MHNQGQGASSLDAVCIEHAGMTPGLVPALVTVLQHDRPSRGRLSK